MNSVSAFRDDQIALEAIQWIEKLADASADLNEEFADWMMRSPDHVRHFLNASAILEELSEQPGFGPLRLVPSPELDVSGAMRHLAMALSPECRRAFTLRKVYGWSGSQIAECLQISQAAVEAQLSEASLRLGRLL